jgi:hypothetical protein
MKINNTKKENDKVIRITIFYFVLTKTQALYILISNSYNNILVVRTHVQRA